MKVFYFFLLFLFYCLVSCPLDSHQLLDKTQQETTLNAVQENNNAPNQVLVEPNPGELPSGQLSTIDSPPIVDEVNGPQDETIKASQTLAEPQVMPEISGGQLTEQPTSLGQPPLLVAPDESHQQHQEAIEPAEQQQQLTEPTQPADQKEQVIVAPLQEVEPQHQPVEQQPQEVSSPQVVATQEPPQEPTPAQQQVEAVQEQPSQAQPVLTDSLAPTETAAEAPQPTEPATLEVSTSTDTSQPEETSTGPSGNETTSMETAPGDVAPQGDEKTEKQPDVVEEANSTQRATTETTEQPPQPTQTLPTSPPESAEQVDVAPSTTDGQPEAVNQTRVDQPAAEVKQEPNEQVKQPNEEPPIEPANPAAPTDASVSTAAVQLATASSPESAANQPPVEANKPNEEANELPAEHLTEEEPVVQINYHLDVESCGSVPKTVLESTTSRILASLGVSGNPNCSSLTGHQQLKLKPTKNKFVKGYVMEVSSMEIEASQLVSSPTNKLACIAVGQQTESNKFKLSLEQDLDDNRQLSSRWRLHRKLNQNDMYVNHKDQMGAGRSRLFGNSMSTNNDKCQPFKLDTGTFNLHLLSMKTRLVFQVDTQNNSIELVDFQVRQLYLDHELRLDMDEGDERLASAIGKVRRSKLAGHLGHLGHAPHQHPHVQLTTSQILHDKNNHHRRNNWLLDMYANWLKHEYRGQLRALFGSDGPLMEQLNYCFN